MAQHGAGGQARGGVHAIVIAYATGFDSASATIAKSLRRRKGSAEPDIDRCGAKRGHARNERFRGK